jgi:hypothetical protein
MNNKQTNTENTLESQIIENNPCKNDKECQKRLIDAMGDCA